MNRCRPCEQRRHNLCTDPCDCLCRFPTVTEVFQRATQQAVKALADLTRESPWAYPPCLHDHNE